MKIDMNGGETSRKNNYVCMIASTKETIGGLWAYESGYPF